MRQLAIIAVSVGLGVYVAFFSIKVRLTDALAVLALALMLVVLMGGR